MQTYTVASVTGTPVKCVVTAANPTAAIARAREMLCTNRALRVTNVRGSKETPAPALSQSQLALLIEALDSHMYWQLATQEQRRDGHVIYVATDDNADDLAACERLTAKLESMRQ